MGCDDRHSPYYKRLNLFPQLLLLNVLSDIERNRYENDDTDGNVLRVCIDTEELEGYLQKLEDSNTDDGGRNLTTSTGDGYTAEGAGCDTFHLVGKTGIDGCTTGLGTEHEACHCEEGRCLCIDEYKGKLYRYTSDLCSLCIATDSIHVLTMTGHVVNEPGNTGHDDGHPDQEAESQETSCRESGIACNIATERSCTGVDEAETIDDFHHCQRGNEWRNTEVGDEPSGDGTEAAADQHDEQQYNEWIQRCDGGHEAILKEASRIILLLKKCTCDTCTEANHTSTGKIAASGDNAA